jgi:hypothetical protein
MCCFGGDYPILLFEAEHSHGGTNYEDKGRHKRGIPGFHNQTRETDSEGRAGEGGRKQRKARILENMAATLNDQLKGYQSQALSTAQRGAKQKLSDRPALRPVDSLRPQSAGGAATENTC